MFFTFFWGQQQHFSEISAGGDYRNEKRLELGAGDS